MFGNNTPTRAWNEFLDFLGERILMDGWRKYAGDLDRSGASGKESLFTHWYDFQVRFAICDLFFIYLQKFNSPR